MLLLLVTAVQMYFALQRGSPPVSWSRLALVYDDLLAAHAIYTDAACNALSLKPGV